MNNIFVVSLEPIETRYTVDWAWFIPMQLEKFAEGKFKITNILGNPKVSNETTPGAFLNFSNTNIWKNDQINIIADLFNSKKVLPGDKFLFTDAWNTGIIQLRYMSDLLGIPIQIHSIWHAGSYDPNDFLGRKIKDKAWSITIERALYLASDYNYFATTYHWNLFLKNVLENDFFKYQDKSIICGFPFDYLKSRIEAYSNVEKENIVLFPHRISPEKNPELFLELKKLLPQYKFVMCQETSLTKQEYYELLGKSKLVFSANLQETLGISMYEGLLAGCKILVPDRLSYSEIYNKPFKYYPQISDHVYYIMDHIIEIMETQRQTPEEIKLQIKKCTNWFSGEVMFNTIINSPKYK